jgi:hypothetical protein
MGHKSYGAMVRGVQFVPELSLFADAPNKKPKSRSFAAQKKVITEIVEPSAANDVRNNGPRLRPRDGNYAKSMTRLVCAIVRDRSRCSGACAEGRLVFGSLLVEEANVRERSIRAGKARCFSRVSVPIAIDCAYERDDARALAISSATSSIMSSWPPTVLRRPSSTRISREGTPYFSPHRLAKSKNDEYTPA